MATRFSERDRMDRADDRPRDVRDSPEGRGEAGAHEVRARLGRVGWTAQQLCDFLVDLWRSACRRTVFRRCGVVALVVGTLLSLLNQGDLIAAGRFDRAVMLRIVGNYLIPFIVSNLGAMTPLPPRDPDIPRDGPAGR